MTTPALGMHPHVVHQVKAHERYFFIGKVQHDQHILRTSLSSPRAVKRVRRERHSRARVWQRTAAHAQVVQVDVMHLGASAGLGRRSHCAAGTVSGCRPAERHLREGSGHRWRRWQLCDAVTCPRASCAGEVTIWVKVRISGKVDWGFGGFWDAMKLTQSERNELLRSTLPPFDSPLVSSVRRACCADFCSFPVHRKGHGCLQYAQKLIAK